MKFFSFFILLFCLAGCGYHYPGRSGELPGGVKNLYIPLFVNKTTEPRLETAVTSQVSEVFSRNEKIHQVEKQKDADAVLLGTIRSYKTEALSYDRNDDIGTYYSTLNIDAELRRTETNELLWKGSVEWKEVYSSSSDKNIQEIARKRALQRSIVRLSEELFYSMLDDF